MAPGDTPFSNPLDGLVGYQLRRASASLMVELGHDLATIGLKPIEASVLALIAANRGITQSDIGRILQIKRANMAPLAAVLDSRGLIARERVDGRSHGLAVTAAGEQLAAAALAAMAAHDRRILATVPASFRQILADLLPPLWTASAADPVRRRAPEPIKMDTI